MPWGEIFAEPWSPDRRGKQHSLLILKSHPQKRFWSRSARVFSSSDLGTRPAFDFSSRAQRFPRNVVLEHLLITSWAAGNTPDNAAVRQVCE